MVRTGKLFYVEANLSDSDGIGRALLASNPATELLGGPWRSLHVDTDYLPQRWLVVSVTASVIAALCSYIGFAEWICSIVTRFMGCFSFVWVLCDAHFRGLGVSEKGLGSTNDLCILSSHQS